MYKTITTVVIVGFMVSSIYGTHASLFAEMETETTAIQTETLAALSKTSWPLPPVGSTSEEEILARVYATAPQDNLAIQTMIEQFKEKYRTVSLFKFELEKTVAQNGPLAAHRLLLEFGNLLIHFEQESDGYNLVQNPLYGYYSLVYKMSLIKRATECAYDEEAQQAIMGELKMVHGEIEHLFDSRRERALWDNITYGNQWLKDWVQEKKDRSMTVKTSESDITVKADGAKTSISKIPAAVKVLSCSTELLDEPLMLLLKKLSLCHQLNSLDINLGMVSNNSLMALVGFLTIAKSLKKCEIDFSELHRLDVSKYKAIKDLDRAKIRGEQYLD
jgi:hypothetical protein